MTERSREVREQPMVRWLVTGAGGMLGCDLVTVLAEAGQGRVSAPARAELDITDLAAVRSAVPGHDVVINAAAYTNVDRSEADPDLALAVNGHAVDHLATVCRSAGARLLHLSTDYVFSGDCATPYAEDAETGPINAYGRSKLAGETAVLAQLPSTGYVVRSEWLYGEHGHNFVATMLRLAAERDTVDVVDDQSGQPTWSYTLAQRLVQLGLRAADGTAPPGVYHATGTGQTTWFGLARAVFSLAGLDPERVRPITSDTLARPARRPANSVLSQERWKLAGLPPMPEWQAMLSLALRRRKLFG